jgi:hypothetical protein
MGAIYTIYQFYKFLRLPIKSSSVFRQRRLGIFNVVGRKTLVTRLWQAALLTGSAAIISKSVGAGGWTITVLFVVSAALAYDARQIFIRLTKGSYGTSGEDVKEVARFLLRSGPNNNLGNGTALESEELVKVQPKGDRDRLVGPLPEAT